MRYIKKKSKLYVANKKGNEKNGRQDCKTREI